MTARRQAPIVITGGAGFIGANLCRELLRRGWERVIAFDDLSTGCEANLAGLPVDLVVGNVRDASALDGVVAGARSVVHLAARPSVPRSIRDPVASHEVNASGTLSVLEAARRHGVHVVVASSSSVYGLNPALPKSEDLVTMPASPYAASKLAAEAYTMAYAHAFGLRALVFRFFNVYGPLQPAGHAYAAIIPSFLDAAVRGQPLVVHGDGYQTRDFTYVATVVSILATAALEAVVCDGPVNLAFGTRTSVLDVVAELERLMGRSLDVEHTEARVGDVRQSQADNGRLRRLFPELAPVPLADGLASTLAWFESTLVK